MLFTFLKKLKLRNNYDFLMDNYKIADPERKINDIHRHVVKYARKGSANLLNRLFFISFFVKAQKAPNEEMYNKWVHEFADLAFESGKKFYRPVRKWNNSRRKLAFIGLGDDPSAYLHVYHLCKYFNSSGNLKPYLFLFKGQGDVDRIKSHFNRVNTDVVIINFNEANILESCCAMRKVCEDNHVDIAVWVHLPAIMFPLFGMRIAKKQVFLSQYLHPDLKKYQIDGLITYGTIVEKQSVFLKDKWRVFPSSISISKKKHAYDLLLRKSFCKRESTIILSTFGRIEKIRQLEFLGCVAEILNRADSTVYIYTGYEDDPQIGAFFHKKGLGERVRFIGWVDIDIYLPIIDIILDSFPLASGITALKAMAYGKPVLSLGNMYSYMGRDIKPLMTNCTFRGYAQADRIFYQLREVISKLPFQPYANNKEDYIFKGLNLVHDKNIRKKISEFQFICSQKLYQNTELMGEIFTEHINEICKNRKL
jgi:glycosyltransferase involved in cell wall biosynthesis